MSQTFFDLLSEAIFWLILFLIGSVCVKKTGFSRKPLNTAKNSILSMNKKMDEFFIPDEKKHFAKPAGLKVISEGRKITSISKDAKKAHNALAVYCYDNRLNKESAETLKTIDRILDVLHKLSKNVLSSEKEYDKAISSLIKETDRAVKQIQDIVK